MVNAKNYLNQDELQALNNLVEQYLVFAEGQAMRRIPMKMTDWVKKLDGFLTLNDRDILNHAGQVSHDMAKQLAESEYDKFQQHRLQLGAKESTKADNHVDELAKTAEQLTKPNKKTK